MKEAAAPVTVIKPVSGWVPIDIAELWRFRELLVFLSWRDIRVRYRQTMFGVAWAVIQPLLPTAIFSVFFGRFAGIPSDGVPYPVFVFAAMVPWQLFAFSLSEASGSLVTNRNLVTKIYFPRLLVPMSAVAVGLVDFTVGFAGLLALMAWYGLPIRLALLAAPLFVLLTILTALSVGLWMSALNARYRDVRYTVPFIIQFWLFATPVVYPASLVPAKWQLLYALNPMTGVIEGFRWMMLGTASAPGPSILIGFAVTLVTLIGGLFFFRRIESSMADVI